MPNFAELIAELCRTNCRTLYGRTTRDLLSNFAELIAELCTVRFGTVRPNFDPYSSAERRTSKIRVRPITTDSICLFYREIDVPSDLNIRSKAIIAINYTVFCKYVTPLGYMHQYLVDRSYRVQTLL